MAAPSPPDRAARLRLLFADTFEHDTTRQHVDEIKFREPVVIREVRVVKNGEQPHSAGLRRFRGETLPKEGAFELEAFVRKMDGAAQSRFDRLIGKVTVTGAGPFRLPSLCSFPTDHLVLRGTFERVTLCVYGTLAPRRPESKERDRRERGSDKARSSRERSRDKSRETSRERERMRRKRPLEEADKAADEGPGEKRRRTGGRSRSRSSGRKGGARSRSGGREASADKRRQLTSSQAKGKSPAATGPASPPPPSHAQLPLEDIFPPGVLNAVLFDPWRAPAAEAGSALPFRLLAFLSLEPEEKTQPPAQGDDAMPPALLSQALQAAERGNTEALQSCLVELAQLPAATVAAAAVSRGGLAALLKECVTFVSRPVDRSSFEASAALLLGLLQTHQGSAALEKKDGGVMAELVAVLASDVASLVKEIILSGLLMALARPAAVEAFIAPGPVRVEVWSKADASCSESEVVLSGYQAVVALLSAAEGRLEVDAAAPISARAGTLARALLARCALYDAGNAARKSVRDLARTIRSGVATGAGADGDASQLESHVASASHALSSLLTAVEAEIELARVAAGPRAAMPFQPLDYYHHPGYADRLRAAMRQGGVTTSSLSFPELPLPLPECVSRLLGSFGLVDLLTAALSLPLHCSTQRAAMCTPALRMLVILTASLNGLKLIASAPAAALRRLLASLLGDAPSKPRDGPWQPCLLGPPEPLLPDRLSPAYSDPSLALLLSQRQGAPHLSAPAVGRALLRHLRSLVLVHKVHEAAAEESLFGEERLAALHLLHLLSTAPSAANVGHEAVAFALFALGAFATPTFLSLFEPAPAAQPPSDADAQQTGSKRTHTLPWREYAVQLLQVITETDYFGLVGPSLAQQYGTQLASSSFGTRGPASFRQQVTILLARLEPAIVLKDRGVAALCRLIQEVADTQAQHADATANSAPKQPTATASGAGSSGSTSGGPADGKAAPDSPVPVRTVPSHRLARLSSAVCLLRAACHGVGEPAEELGLEGGLGTGAGAAAGGVADEAKRVLTALNIVCSQDFINALAKAILLGCAFFSSRAKGGRTRDADRIRQGRLHVRLLVDALAVARTVMERLARVDRATLTHAAPLFKAVVRVVKVSSLHADSFSGVWTASSCSSGATPTDLVMAAALYTGSSAPPPAPSPAYLPAAVARLARDCIAIGATLELPSLSSTPLVADDSDPRPNSPASLLARAARVPGFARGCLHLLASLLPPPLSEAGAWHAGDSSTDSRSLVDERDVWVTALDGQPLRAHLQELHLQRTALSSSRAMQEPALRLVVRLADLHDQLALPIIEPMVDELRASVLKLLVTGPEAQAQAQAQDQAVAGPDSSAGAAAEVPATLPGAPADAKATSPPVKPAQPDLICLITRLLKAFECLCAASVPCQWLLNDLGLVIALHPLLAAAGGGQDLAPLQVAALALVQRLLPPALPQAARDYPLPLPLPLPASSEGAETETQVVDTAAQRQWLADHSPAYDDLVLILPEITRLALPPLAPAPPQDAKASSVPSPLRLAALRVLGCLASAANKVAPSCRPMVFALLLPYCSPDAIALALARHNASGCSTELACLTELSQCLADPRSSSPPSARSWPSRTLLDSLYLSLERALLRCEGGSPALSDDAFTGRGPRWMGILEGSFLYTPLPSLTSLLRPLLDKAYAEGLPPEPKLLQPLRPPPPPKGSAANEAKRRSDARQVKRTTTPTFRDTFRHRKTGRAPSLHVDDFQTLTKAGVVAPGALASTATAPPLALAAGFAAMPLSRPTGMLPSRAAPPVRYPPVQYPVRHAHGHAMLPPPPRPPSVSHAQQRPQQQQYGRRDYGNYGYAGSRPRY